MKSVNFHEIFDQECLPSSPKTKMKAMKNMKKVSMFSERIIKESG